MDDQSVQCCVTSPPYWGLRDYGHGDQLGLEKMPEEYVRKLVSVFRELRRVLKDDGTLWLNLGDSYSGGGGFCPTAPSTAISKSGKYGTSGAAMRSVGNVSGLKPKDLVGIPWRVAFALQADGWYLRSDIIWSKPNPMPESVTDRPTKAHEYIFLLSKSQRYYYDAGAIEESTSWTQGVGQAHRQRRLTSTSDQPKGNGRAAAGVHNPLCQGGTSTTRNRRSVWTVPTQPFPGAHFAVFPPALIEPCILAGAPEGATVLDPFAGSGTVGVVCRKHRRDFIGIELNPEYARMARGRCGEDVTADLPEEDAPLFNRSTA
jgi:DNA modification methylase